MSNKKSFILHIDSLDILEKLTDEQSGKLLKAMLDYHKGNDLNLTWSSPSNNRSNIRD